MTIAIGNKSEFPSAAIAAGTPFSWSHTVSAGSDRLLVVCIQTTAGEVSSVTFNGDALSRLDGGGANMVSDSGTTRTEIWVLVAPDVTTANIQVSLSSAGQASAQASDWTGVDQSAPVGTFVGATGSSSTPSVAVSATSDDVVVDSVGQFSISTPALTVGASQTLIHESGNFLTGGASYEAGDTSVTMSWTSDESAAWAIGAVPLKIVSLVKTKAVAGALAAGSFVGATVKESQKSLSGTFGSVSGAVTKTTGKIVAGALATGNLTGSLIANVVKKVAVAGELVAGRIVGALGPWTYGKGLGGTVAPAGSVSRLTSKNVSGDVTSVSGSVTKSVAKAVAGVLAAGNVAGSVIASFIKDDGGAELRAAGVFVVSGLEIQEGTGGRLYIEVYDSLGNKLGSGPIFQITKASITKRLDRGGEFAFEIPAADDRANLIEQGREIRVYREGEGEIYRGLIERAMWDVGD